MSNETQKFFYDKHPSFRVHHTIEPTSCYNYPAHLHYDTSLVILYVKHGTGNIRIEGNLYDIKDGDVILLSPYELHACTFDSGLYHERITLYLHESIMDPFHCPNHIFFDIFFKRQSGLGNRLLAKDVREHHISDSIQRILDLVKQNDEEHIILAICAIVELLSKLKQAILPQLHNEVAPAPRNQLINDVLAYVGEHFTEELKIEEIASRFYVSKYHLCRLFKECVGTTLWEYLTYRRIMAFNDLVRQKYSLEDACYQAGFRNYSNFYRLYKKYMKITPSQFKQQLAEKQ